VEANTSADTGPGPRMRPVRRPGDRSLAAAREAEKQVHVWTVNDPEEMNRLIGLGVDAVITNYPDRFPGP
jgi:glycerophosphoryl diester phosphodiesterase